VCSSLLVLSLFSGCSSSGGSEAGGVDAGSDGAGKDVADATPDTAGSDGFVATDGGGASFSAVLAIFGARCVRCHDPAHPIVLETPTYVEMPLTPDTAYAALVGQPAHETCGGTRVTPGDPSQSYLYHKVTDDPPCDGKRMPHPGMLSQVPPLPQSEIDVIAGWIRAGAPP
jgi:hypothetical protein